MIQSWIMDKLKAEITGVSWTVDYESTSDPGVTIFYEGGGDPSDYDLEYRYPRYMAWISSSDFEESEYLADEIFDQLHKIRDIPITINFSRNGTIVKTKNVILKKLVAATSPNRIGVSEGKMQYSVNFDATIIDQKEDNSNETT